MSVHAEGYLRGLAVAGSVDEEGGFEVDQVLVEDPEELAAELAEEHGWSELEEAGYAAMLGDYEDRRAPAWLSPLIERWGEAIGAALWGSTGLVSDRIGVAEWRFARAGGA